MDSPGSDSTAVPLPSGHPNGGSPADPAAPPPAARHAASVEHRVARLTGVQVLACGAYAPPQVVTNEDLAPHGYDADWIVQRTGIRQRRRAADNMAASDLAYEA